MVLERGMKDVVLVVDLIAGMMEDILVAGRGRDVNSGRGRDINRE
jgi:hypothetical protein